MGRASAFDFFEAVVTESWHFSNPCGKILARFRVFAGDWPEIAGTSFGKGHALGLACSILSPRNWSTT
jgi:hypothetical protein